MRTWGIISVAVVVCVVAATAARGGVTIPGVPYYEWYYGCGPTAGGMIMGYWDGKPGLGDLVPGSNDWGTNAAGIKDMIASPGHIADYVGWGAGSDGPLPFHA
ncbi:MAG: hypothetical protein IMZ55_04955, partial [Acidobacteria bacterium]|nr:hypothetical protein [Acidobacteriota bacterium]